MGTGKSAAADAFKRCGAEVIDADILAREVVEPGSEGLAEILKTFGPAAIAPDGRLNRKALGRIVFSDVKLRRKLEDILHPLIRAKYLERLQQLLTAKQPPPLIVYVVPLLFESRFEYPELDAIVVISASRETSIARIMARDGLSRSEAERRYDSQLSIDDKAAKADYVISNAGSLRDLTSAVQALYGQLLNI